MKRKIFSVLLVAGLAISLLGTNGFTQEKFRIKFLWHPENSVSQSWFYPQNYSLFKTWDIWQHCGAWVWYFPFDNGGSLGTLTQLSYQVGDVAPLYHMRRVSGNTSDSNFGIEAEIRLSKNFWLAVNYLPTQTFYINTFEENEEAVFSEFDEIYLGYLWEFPYYEYHMHFNRRNIVQQTNEKISSINSQVYLKFETDENNPLQVFAGAGLDIWLMRHKVEQNTSIHILKTWEDKVLSQDVTTVQSQNSKFYFRPFIAVGTQANIAKGLKLGVRFNGFLAGEKYFGFKKTFMLPDSDVCVKDWKFQLVTGSTALLYLNFGF